MYRPFFDEHKLFEKLKKTYETHQETLRSWLGVRDADSDEVWALKQATTTRCNGAMAIDGSFALELPDFLSAYWQWAMTQGLHFDTEAPKDATTIRCDGAAIREILPPSIPLEPLGGELFAVEPIKECRRPQPWLAMAIISVSMRREQSSAQLIDAKGKRLMSHLGTIFTVVSAVGYRSLRDHL